MKITCFPRFCALLFACMAWLSASVVFGNATYDIAYRLSSNGEHEAAIKGFIQAEQEAEAVGDSLTRFSSFYCASFSAHRLSRNSDCLEYAEKALRIAADNQTASWAKRSKQALFEVELIGLLERSLFSMARLGDGWQANRRGVDALRKVISGDSRGPLRPEEVLRLPRMLRPQGWRFIEREAEYLYETGNTTAAKELLNAAMTAAKPDLESNDYYRAFYPLKLVGKLGIIEGFVGDEPRAIELYELEYAYAQKWSKRRNLIRIRLNLLAEIAEYRGANEAIVEEADALLSEFEAGGYNGLGATKRMHAKIVAEKLSADQRLERLLDASRSETEEESLVEAFYASRNALFVRAAENESGLDDEFMRFLSQSRTQGNLRAEPRIYRRYGDWLKQQDRYNEAIRMYRICLDKVLLYEWHSQVILLYAKLAGSYLESGNETLAFSAILALKNYLEIHKELIPPHQVLNALKSWMVALLSNGYADRARDEAIQWHGYGVSHQVPEKYLLSFNEQYIEALIAKSGIGETREANAEPGTFLHPISVTTVGIPLQSARVAFFLLNPGSANESGVLKLTGHGLTRLSALAEQPILIQQTATEGETTLSLPLSLPGGTLVKIYLQRVFASDEDSRVSFEWISSSLNQTATAVWNYSEGASTERAAVMDAAEIRPNPFIGIPVEHTVYFPDESNRTGLPIRIRASQPFRIEYRNSTTGDIIAVDNNGNGDFSESGDFWIQRDYGQPDVKAPSVERSGEESYTSIEVWYFPNEVTSSTALDLSVEVYQDDEWIVQAVDQITLAVD